MSEFLPGLSLRIVGARTTLARLLVLVAVLVFFGTGKASAQFSTENGRGDGAGEGMRDGGRRGTGIGIGIGVGIGESLIEGAAQDDAKKKKNLGAGAPDQATRSGLTQSHRAAKKGGASKDDKGGGAKKDQAKKEDNPPTPWSTDPKGGIEVPDMPGVTVHRGTGTVTGFKGGDRKGIYCWVHSDKDKCKKTAQYQFVTVNIEAKWGTDPQANINDVVKSARVQHGGFLPPNDNGVEVKPGQLVGDDYNSTRNEDPVNITDADGKNIKEPNGKEIKAGAYVPRKIPGGGGDMGLIDAPYTAVSVGGFAGALVPAKLKEDQVSPTPPRETDIGTITVFHHFRSYVYCLDPKKCLGFFEWDYNETVTIVRKWKVKEGSSDLGSSMLGGMQDSGGSRKKGKGQPAEEPEKKTWTPSFEVKGAPKVDGPTIGEWKPCP